MLDSILYFDFSSSTCISIVKNHYHYQYVRLHGKFVKFVKLKVCKVCKVESS